SPQPDKKDISVQVKSIISPERIVFMNHPSKHDSLVELSDNLATAPQVKDAKELQKEILKREELMSTAIGRGIAIPHVRLASVTDLVMSVGISKVDVIDFNPIDDIPVRLIFMIAAAYNQHSYYLQTISYFSAKIRDPQLRDSLLAAASPDEAYSLLVK
ncbi:MAG: PTS sugar transporter subunit IIA, partial [Treponema sp.]|nr:PTS sugar transporter subunit IIA [Treponema sp.]